MFDLWTYQKSNFIKSKRVSISKCIYDFKHSKCVVFAKFVTKIPFEDCDPEFTIWDILFFEKEVNVFYFTTKKYFDDHFKKITTCLIHSEHLAFLIGLNNCQILTKTTYFSEFYYGFYFWWS